MTMKIPRKLTPVGLSWFLRSSALLAAVGCSSDGGDLDSESHFACRADSDCVPLGPGSLCVGNACVGPASDCVAGSCDGKVLGMVTYTQHGHLLEGQPMVSVDPVGDVTVFFSRMQSNGTVDDHVVRRLTPALSEQWTLTTQPLTLLQLWNTSLFVNHDGLVIAEEYDEASVVRLSAFDSTGAVQSDHTVVGLSKSFALHATSEGNVTVFFSDQYSLDPAPPDCPEPDAVVTLDAQSIPTAVHCFRGISLERIVAAPHGFGLTARIEGPTDPTLVDLGGGTVEARLSSGIVARYSADWTILWSVNHIGGFFEVALPGPDGGMWAVGRGPLYDEPWAADLRSSGILERLDVDRFVLYFDPTGVARVARWAPTEAIVDLAVDTAGNAIELVEIASSVVPCDPCQHELRKVLRDGSVAWTTAITGPPTAFDLAVGRGGEVYLVTMNESPKTLSVGNKSVEGPAVSVS